MSKRWMSMASSVAVAALGLVAVAVSGGMPGCKKSSAPEAGTKAVTASAVGQTPADNADDLLSTKLGFYIDCVNTVDSEVIKSRDSYLKYLTEARQVNPKQTPVVSTIGTHVTDKCFKGLEDAAKLTPKVADVEESGAGYKAALDALMPMLVEGAHYYQQNDYKDDAFAKGNALNEKLIPAYQAFFTARTKLHDSIDKYNKQILARSLARIEKEEGKSLRYYSRRIMNDGSTLLDQTLDPATDPVALSASIEAYKTVYAEMMDLAAKSPDKVDLIKNWSGFTNYGNLVLLQFKEVQRAIKDQQAADKTRPFVIPKSTRELLLNYYNEMVEDSNELEFKSKDA